MNIISIAQWLLGADFEILHFSDTLHDVTNFLNQTAHSNKHVSIFYREKWRQLRQNYSKGPFCLTRFIYLYVKLNWISYFYFTVGAGLFLHFCWYRAFVTGLSQITSGFF